MEQARDIPRYEEFDTVGLPAAIPEMGIEAGHPATILELHGDSLVLDVSDDSGRTLDLVDAEIIAGGLEVRGRWHLSPEAAKARG